MEITVEKKRSRVRKKQKRVQFNCCDIVFTFGGGERTWNDKIEEHQISARE